MDLRRFFFLPVLLFTLAAGQAARADDPPTDYPLGGFDPFKAASGPGETKSSRALIPEVKSIAPGKPFTIALSLSHPDEWHSYYKNSGGVEQSPSLKVELPEGFTAGPLQWPTPHVKDAAFIIEGSPFQKSFCYPGSPVFLMEITPPANLAPGSSVTLKADAHWQICKESCLPEDQKFELTLPVAETAEIDSSKTALFTGARAKLPVSDSSLKVVAEASGPDVRLRIQNGSPNIPDLSKTPLEFIPDYPMVNSFSQGGSVSHEANGDWIITLQRLKETAMGSPVDKKTSISGLLMLGEPGSKDFRAVLIPELAIGKAPAVPLPFSSFLPVLGGMLLGGLILNLMPCVFPVLGLKIMGFVQQSGQDKKKIVAHGVAFAVGVLLSFWIVSGLLFFLREHSTTDIGWGYQLQNKWFVYGLVMLFYVFGLSMFGLFEIGVSATSVGGKLQAKSGLAGSFFSGVLATVAATPCSAPILGPAIGAAITLPGFQFFLAFTAMALGLALPYLIFSLFPKLVDLLPRPGPWMESFKQGMAFLLLGAAAYFFWVYLDHVVPDVVVLVFLGMVLIAAAAWVYGRWATPYKKTSTRNIGRVFALVMAFAGFYLVTGPYKGLEWQTWSQGKVDDYLEKDTPVYVDFTAKWCATCQVNKKVAYTPEVVALFKERGIVPLRADKTKPDPEIDAKVEEFHRAAIPVNVLYVPGKPPIVTPAILTPAYMKELIEKEVPKKEKEKEADKGTASR